MNILCLNTAFTDAHIALKFMGKDYFETIDSNSKHSENLLVAIEKLFERAIKKENLNITGNKVLKELDVVAVVIGPGSFTGLRISIATVKAIMVTNPKIKAVAINTLELLANEFTSNNKLKKNATPVIDALSGLFYIAEFDKNLVCITPPKMIEEKELKKHKNLISNDSSLVKTPIILTPEILLSLAQLKINSESFISEKELTPLYLRPSQAEAELKCRQKLNK